jgi:hypothetical protein
MADTDDLLKMDLGLGSRTASQIDLSWLLPDSFSCVLSQKTMCVCVLARLFTRRQVVSRARLLLRHGRWWVNQARKKKGLSLIRDCTVAAHGARKQDGRMRRL